MKTPLHTILAAGLALAVLSAPARAITFPAFADTAGAPPPGVLSKSAGKATTLAVSAKSTAYVSFNVSGSGLITDPTAVTAARLIIYFPKITKAGNITVTANGTAFSETLPGPSPSPSGTLAGLAPAPFSVGPGLSKNFFIVDVTGIVQTWLLNPGLEQGFGVSGDATVSATIGAKEGSGSGYPVVLEVDASTTTGTLFGTNADFLGKLGIGTFTPQSAVQVGDFSVPSVDNFLSVVSSGVNGSTPPADRLSGINLQNFDNTYGFTIQSRDGVSSAGLEIINSNGAVGGPPAMFIDRATSEMGLGTKTPDAPLSIRADNVALQTWKTNSGVTRWGLNINSFGNATGLFFTETGVNPANLMLQPGGNVGINTAFPSAKLEVNGGIKCIGAVDTSSDLRFKMNIQPLAGALGQTLRLRGVSYDWNRAKFPNKDFNDRRQLGFIAQEVREILPEVVSEDPDGYLSIGYSAIIPVLVEAVKELQQQKDAEIATLKAANLALAAKMAAFDEKLTALKASLDDRPARTVRASLDLK